jgi:hypothetical protein
METQNLLHFAILLPHPELAASLRGQSRALFAAGLEGAWSFPLAAPLARLKRPLTEAELRDLAGTLREASLPRGGKIALGKPILVPCPGFHSFFGPALDLEPPPLPYPAVLHRLGALALTIALAAPAEVPRLEQMLETSPPKPGFFRAAMTANLSIRPLKNAYPAEAAPGAYPAGAAENYSFEWRLGKPRWLPPLRGHPGGA